MAANGPPMHHIETLYEQIRTARKRVLVLAVMQSGGPYTEDSEMRVRSRHAVVTALGRAAYAPEDDEHIGFVTIDWPRMRFPDWQGYKPPIEAGSSPEKEAASKPGLGDVSLNIPYEWWRQQGTSYEDTSNSPAAEPRARTILVLWLNEDAF